MATRAVGSFTSRSRRKNVKWWAVMPAPRDNVHNATAINFGGHSNCTTAEREGSKLQLRRQSWIGKDQQVRFYRNIWGSNAGTPIVAADEQKSAPQERHTIRLKGQNARLKVQDYLKVQDSLKVDGGWRLDWEEDGRWVEWRLDEEAQSEDERFRVVMEWKRYLDARGRTNTNLWEEDEEKTSGFNRGSSSWWREQYYSYEYAGAGGVSSMSAVKEAAATLEISDAGDAGAVRANYLRLVNVWHPDRYHHNTAEEQAAASDKFRKVQAAYELLKERQSATR